MLLGSSPHLWPCQMSEISSCSAFLIIFCLTVDFCCNPLERSQICWKPAPCCQARSVVWIWRVDVGSSEIEEVSDISLKVKIKWGYMETDRCMPHWSLHVFVFNDCGELYVYPHTWILQHMAPGMDNPAPQLRPGTDVNVSENGMTKMYISSQSMGWVDSAHYMVCNISCAECY